MSDEIKRFEVGKKYTYILPHERANGSFARPIAGYKCIKRTKCFITFKELFHPSHPDVIKRKKVKIYRNQEVCCMTSRHAQMSFHDMYADQEAYYLLRGKD